MFDEEQISTCTVPNSISPSGAPPKSPAQAQLGKQAAFARLMDFERGFRAACGYAELGMASESLAELKQLSDEDQCRPEVLQLRLHHLMRKKQWSRALGVSRKLCRAAPQCSAGFLHAGFCLHELGKTREAKELLLKGPTALLQEPIYYYNMGCYEVLLGNLQDARVHLHISFKMDSTFRELAKRDPDLAPLHEVL